HPPAVDHGGDARRDRGPVDRRASGSGLPRAPRAQRAEPGRRTHRPRGPDRRARPRGARAQARAPRRGPEHRGERGPAPARAARADRDPARRRLAHDALLRHQGRRADRSGGAGERADPGPRKLPAARACRVRVARHAGARQGAVPHPGRVGGAAPGGDSRRRAGGVPGAREPRDPAAAGTRHTAARRPRRPPSMMANLSRRERTIIAAGLAVAIGIGGWSFVVEPILEANRSARELVPAREEVLQKKRDLIARKGAIEAELRTTIARLDSAPKLLTVQDVRVRVVNVSQPKDLLTTLTLSGYILPGKTRI